MCEYVDAKELAEIRKGIYVPKKTKRKNILGGFVIGGLGILAGVALGYKLGSKKCNVQTTQDLTEEEV